MSRANRFFSEEEYVRGSQIDNFAKRIEAKYLARFGSSLSWVTLSQASQPFITEELPDKQLVRIKKPWKHAILMKADQYQAERTRQKAAEENGLVSQVYFTTCDDCRHASHSGAFTPGGAIPCFDYDDTVAKRGAGKKDPNHWRHRVLKERGKRGLVIPQWCPLRTGGRY
jgi:hypothetical protein